MYKREVSAPIGCIDCRRTRPFGSQETRRRHSRHVWPCRRPGAASNALRARAAGLHPFSFSVRRPHADTVMKAELPAGCRSAGGSVSIDDGYYRRDFCAASGALTRPIHIASCADVTALEAHASMLQVVHESTISSAPKQLSAASDRDRYCMASTS